MSRSARELLASLADDDVVELDHVLTAACMAAAFRKDPRRVFKSEKKKHKGRMRKMLTAFQKASDLSVILNNHYMIMEQQGGQRHECFFRDYLLRLDRDQKEEKDDSN